MDGDGAVTESQCEAAPSTFTI